MGQSTMGGGRWLNPVRVRGYLWVFALLHIAGLLWLVTTATDGADRNGALLGTDFLSFWTVGRMLQGGADVYDTTAHIAAQRAFFAQDGYVAFFYPPPFLLLCYPLGYLGYFPALAAWLLATGTAFAAVARLWLRRSGVDRTAWLLLLAFPPVFLTVTHGQTSFLVAAALGLGFLMLHDRPVLAGICFGLAIVKPQFGPLAPLVLLLTGHWRALAAAAATACLFAFCTTLAFGTAVWSGWLAAGASAQAALAGGTVGFAKMQSPLAAALLLGAPLGFAYALQGVVALLVAAALARAAWRRPFTVALGAATLAGALLVTPFVLDYDLLLLAFPLIWLAGRRPRPAEALIAALAFAAPAFARPLALEFGLPITPVVLAALFAVLVRRAWREKADERDG